MILKNPHIRQILLLALFLRILLPLVSWGITGDSQRFFQPDTPTYLHPAQEWLQTGHYAVQQTPELMRPPGYAFFLLPGIITGWVVPLTILCQILLSVTTVYVTLRIAQTITSNTTTLRLIGLLSAIEPLSIIYTSQLLTETLFTTLTTTGLYTLIRSSQSQKCTILSALLYAGATFVRPIGYYIPIILLIPLIYARCSPKQIALFILIALGLPGLWQVRNWSVANYTSFSAISSINLYFYQAASIKAKINGTSFTQQQDQMGYGNETQYLLTHPEQTTWTQAQKFKYMASEGLHTVLQHPITYTQIHTQGIIRTLFDPGAIDLLKLLDLYPKRGGLLGRIVDQGIIQTLISLIVTQPLIFIANLFLGLLLLAYYILSLLAFKPPISLPKMPIIFCLVTSLYFIALSGGPHSLNRFRHPVMPIVVIFAGLGFERLQQSKSRKH